MARNNYKEVFRKALLGFISEKDPVLTMLEWVAQQMMQIEAEAKVGTKKGTHCKKRQTYFSGTRVRRMDTSRDFISFHSQAPQGRTHTVFHHREEAF